MTLKVRFRHFLTTRVNICESQIKKNIFILLIFLLKWSPCWLTSTKLHHWGHTTTYILDLENGKLCNESPWVSKISCIINLRLGCLYYCISVEWFVFMVKLVMKHYKIGESWFLSFSPKKFHLIWVQEYILI